MCSSGAPVANRYCQQVIFGTTFAQAIFGSAWGTPGGKWGMTLRLWLRSRTQAAGVPQSPRWLGANHKAWTVTSMMFKFKRPRSHVVPEPQAPRETSAESMSCPAPQCPQLVSGGCAQGCLSSCSAWERAPNRDLRAGVARWARSHPPSCQSLSTTCPS